MKQFVKLLLVLVLCPTLVQATSLDGTSSIVYQDKHYVFRNFNTAKGYVRLNNGFTILAGQSAGLDTFVTVSGAIDLRTTGSLDLRSDLFLDQHVTWSSSGKIYGRGNTIHLGGSLSLPTDTIVQFIDDTIIDGHGHALTLGAHAQLLLASDVSLTLRNMTIQTTRNSSNIPIIRCFDQKGHVTLDNVELALADDFPFRTGRMFFNNDVIVTGTSRFVYQSVMQSYVAPHSLLTFDPGTTLYYYPSSTGKDLIQLQDKSSGIYLEGAATTLQATHTGMRLSKGRMWLDNKVTLSTRANTKFNGLTLLDTQNYGTRIFDVSWSPNGRFVAVGGISPTSLDLVQIFGFDGSVFTLIDSATYGADKVESVNFSPDGRFVVVGGRTPTNGQELQVYSFDGSTLALAAGASYGTEIQASTWSRDGRFIAVGGVGPTNGDELQIFRFQYGTLSLIDSANFGSRAETVEWSFDGKYVAVAGTTPNEVHIYSFNGTSLTFIDSASHTSIIEEVAWSPDSRFIAFGGLPRNVTVYSFNGTSLGLADSVTTGPRIEGLNWDPSGNYLAIAGRDSTTTSQIEIYQFNGSALSLIFEQHVTTAMVAGLETIAWDPSGKYLLVGGSNPDAGFDELNVFSVSYRFDTSTQALTNGISLGNSTSGASFDLDTYVLSGANVNLAGQLFYDSTS
ncbi:WD40 repeat domain-containing protein [Candidatus Babeliales bacterium]|nr:WD40 repeat domain-containing protein [Candidatus Babeliales bacterium]